MGSLRGRLQLWKVCSHAGSTHEATRVGRTAGELFFYCRFLQRRGAQKVEFCCAVWGFLQSREWSLWWGSNASRNVRPVQQWPTSTKSKDQLRVCLIICLIHANFRGRPPSKCR